ncbi:MAG: hypothetical protein JSW43_08210 [Gemmatimonadota bacterium]|nr:MAG: hypothetical protein JSW43_08210 [Gemmatimonadota bacterium]
MTESRTKSAVIAGVIAALVGGFLWALIVVFTGYEVGWVAWGVGALVGFVMLKVAGMPSPGLGVRAAVLAAVGLLVGKWLIIEIGARTQLRDEIAGNPELLQQAVFVDMIENEGLPPDLTASIEAIGEEDEVPDSVMQRIQEVVDDRIAGMDEDEMDSVATRFAQMFIGELTFLDRMQATMSGWDLLWFFLALGTAWQLASGSAGRAAAQSAAEENMPSIRDPGDG